MDIEELEKVLLESLSREKKRMDIEDIEERLASVIVGARLIGYKKAKVTGIIVLQNAKRSFIINFTGGEKPFYMHYLNLEASKINHYSTIEELEKALLELL